MQVIFLENVKGIARRGEVKNVKDGYFMNFLQPKKLAKIATPDAVKQAKEMEKKMVIEKEKIKEESKLVQSKLNGLNIEVKKKVQGEKLYASITIPELIDAIFKAVTIRLDKTHFNPVPHIKTLGKHKINVRLNEGVNAEVILEVKPE